MLGVFQLTLVLLFGVLTVSSQEKFRPSRTVAEGERNRLPVRRSGTRVRDKTPTSEVSTSVLKLLDVGATEDDSEGREETLVREVGLWDIGHSPWRGPPGYAGPPGWPGKPGMRGWPGFRGPTGAPGSSGAKGPAGVPGIPGPTGSDGPIGPQGELGEPGPVGPQGPPGPPGNAGSPGPPGVSGTPGSIGSQGLPGSPGSTGFNGPQGPPGYMTPYGDGSGGDYTNTETTNWRINPPPTTDFLNFVNSGILRVPSGTIIRCQGTFTNTGTITILPGLPDTVEGQSAALGLAFTEAGSKFDLVAGQPLPESTLRNILNPGIVAGGNGAPAEENGVEVAGGAGGGSLVIIAKQKITNSGDINATGRAGNTQPAAPGSGGGAGGFIVIASAAEVENTGSGRILARGGRGGHANNEQDQCPGDGRLGGGGGGGGGVVHLLGPIITNSGQVRVNGGAAGLCSTEGTFGQGGGGGAMGGAGGSGGGLADRIPSEPGDDGFFFQTTMAEPGSRVIISIASPNS